MPLSGLMGYPLIISMLGSTLFISPFLVLLHLAATLPSHLQLQVQQSVGEPDYLAASLLSLPPAFNPSF